MSASEEVVVVGRRIVIGMDGSNNANDAFEWYLKNVYRDTDYVIMGYCPNLSSGIFNLDSLLPHNLSSVTTAVSSAQESAKEVQRILEEKLAYTGVRGCVEILSGSDAGHALVREAKNNNAALIVIGSRGHGALRRTVMGSVSGYVMHHSHIPVLVHPHIHHHKGRRESIDKYRKNSVTDRKNSVTDRKNSLTDRKNSLSERL